MTEFEKKLIKVCDNCLTASCWYGEFMCQKSKDAGLVLRPISYLRLKNLEHPENWSDEKMELVYGDPAPFGYEA
jgi:epoxyqueuosine reductase QueG